MEKAKAAIKDFTSRTGHHDTTVHEVVAPSVQHEAVKPHEHENITTAVDKEVHQDHYHTTVQPVFDREVLPEQHHAKLGEVQHRTFDNRDHEGTKRALVTEGTQFKDHQVVHETTHTQTANPTIGGEHHHHHIHETIQPIVQKETIQPHVVHTTVPIHETHHQAAQHHSATTLPAVSLAEFKNRGGVLGGREERYDAFEGEPKNIGGFSQSLKEGGLGHSEKGLGHSKHDSHHATDGLGSTTTTTGQHHSGAKGAALGAGAGYAAEKGLGHSDHSDHQHSTGKAAGAALAGAGAGYAGEKAKDHHHHSSTTTGSGGLAGTGGTLGNEVRDTDRTGGISSEPGVGTVKDRTGGTSLDPKHHTSSIAHDKDSSRVGGVSGNHTTTSGEKAALGAGAGAAAGAGAGAVGATKKTEQPGGNLGREAQGGVVGVGVPGFGTHEKSKQGAGPSVGAPSLKDKLDPRVDANGDGKKGIFS